MATVVTNAGRDIATNRIMGLGTEPKQIGVGSGAGTAAVADITLFAEKAADGVATTGTRIAGTSSRQTTGVANDTYRVAGTLVATATWTVTNAGTFDNTAIAAGNLFCKGDFTGVLLNNGDSLALTINVQMT